MKELFLLIILLCLSTPFLGQASYCTVVDNFENKPLNEVFDRWEKWCRISIKYDAADVEGILITKVFDGYSVKNALKIILEDTPLGYAIIDDNSIEIRIKSSIIEHIKVRDEFNNTLLSEVLNTWKTEHELNLHYDKAEIENIRVFGKLRNEPLDMALAKILKNTPLKFEVTKGRNVRIYLPEEEKTALIGHDKISKNIVIRGIIKDEQTGESLPYASVLVQGTTIGTTTNVDGYFSLLNVPTDTAVLAISYIGYQSTQIKLNPDMAREYFELTLRSGSVELDEITIAAVKQDQIMNASSGVSKIGITPEIASVLPSFGEKDIFRSIQLLPGISGTNESSSGLFVRGGTPDQNLILFDGFTVYHVDHLFGFFSAFNSNAIKDVQIYKGGFGAKYGGRLSSVIDITGKDGNTNEFNMGVGLSLLSVNAFVESPFANGKGSFIVTGRRSFQSAFYSNIFDSFTEIGQNQQDQAEQPGGGAFGGRGGFGNFGQTQVQPNSFFYDLNAKLSYRLSKRDKISFSLYNGEDDLDNSRIVDSANLQGGGGRFGQGGNTNFSFVNNNTDISNWGNIGGSLKWSRQWSDKFYSNATASYSNYFSERDRNNVTNITRADTTFVRTTGSFESNDLRDISFKLDNELKINPNNQLDFGIQLTHNDIKYSYTQNNETTLIDRDDQGLTASIYVEDKVTISDRLILNLGLRSNYYSPTSKLYIEPRASFTYLVNDKLKLKGAYGQYNQFATRVIREDIQQGSRDFWVLANDDLIPSSSSTHYVIGGAYETDAYLFDVEAFYKSYDGLSEYTNRLEASGFGRDRTLSIDEQFYTGTGISKGVEFLVQKKFGQFSGWISYTLSDVEYDFKDFSDQPYFANQDQRHEFKLVGLYKLKNFDFATTFVYGTGKPYTAPIGYYEIGLLDGSVEPYFQVSDKNALRYPAYHRWDISANYNFNVGTSKAQIGVSVFNLYNRTNTWYKEYEVIEGQLLETDVSLLGLTPSLFFKWTFR